MTAGLYLTVVAASRAAVAGEPACTLEGDGRDLPAAVLSVKGVPFARTAPFAYHHRVKLRLGRGDPLGRPLALTLDTPHLLLRADVVIEAPLVVQTEKPVGFGVLVSDSGAEVAIRGVEGTLAEIALSAPDEFTPAAPLRARVPCARLSWSLRSVEAPPALDGRGTQSAALAQGDVAVSAAPSGPSAGTLHVGAGAWATIIGQQGPVTRIQWQLQGGLIDGWVPAGAVSAVGAHFGSGVGMLPGKQGFPADLFDGAQKSCRGAVPLSARVGGTEVVIGQLPAGVPFVVTAEDPHGAVIDVELDGLTLLSGVQLVLTPAARRACR